MATAAGVTECSVCHEHFAEPKLLPCAHLLCQDCLIKWMEEQPETNCPVCRNVVMDSEEKPGPTLEDVTDSSPADHSMAALVEATRLLNRPQQYQVCVDVSAAALCLDCGDMMYSQCCVVHGKLSATSHHRVEKLLTLTAEQLASRLPVACSVHASRPSEL